MLLAPLAATRSPAIKLNHGGTSLSLRLDFASGARAAFKPQQTHPQSDPRREIAAYRIDRLLGIGHVAPAKSATFALADLIAAAPADSRDYTTQRLDDEAIAHGGKVSRRGVVVDPRDPRRRDRHASRRRAARHDGVGPVPPGRRAEIAAGARPTRSRSSSTMIVFDVLIDNADRWTGNNTKCSRRSPHAVLHGQHAVVLAVHFRARGEPQPAAPDLEVLAQARRAAAHVDATRRWRTRWRAVTIRSRRCSSPRRFTRCSLAATTCSRYIDGLTRRARRGRGARPAMNACPVCGKPVDPLRAPAVGVRDGKVVAYCSREHALEAETKPTAVPKPKPRAASEPAFRIPEADQKKKRTPAAGIATPESTYDSGPVIEIVHEPASGVVTSAPDARDARSSEPRIPRSQTSGAIQIADTGRVDDYVSADDDDEPRSRKGWIAVADPPRARRRCGSPPTSSAISIR